MTVADSNNNLPDAERFIADLPLVIPQVTFKFQGLFEYLEAKFSMGTSPEVEAWLLGSNYIPDHEHVVKPAQYFQNYELSSSTYKRSQFLTSLKWASAINRRLIRWTVPPMTWEALQQPAIAVIFVAREAEFLMPLFLHTLAPTEQRTQPKGGTVNLPSWQLEFRPAALRK